MHLLTRLWNDERGFVLTSELVLLGTLGVVGTTVGLHAAVSAMNAEMLEVGSAFRSLDQSYHLPGFTGSGAMTAGSAFVQQDVAVSLAELDAIEKCYEPGCEDRAEKKHSEKQKRGKHARHRKHRARPDRDLHRDRRKGDRFDDDRPRRHLERRERQEESKSERRKNRRDARPRGDERRREREIDSETVPRRL